MGEPATSGSWQVNDRVRFRRVFDEAVVIHQEKAEALVLNDTGAAFLELCDGHRSLNEIVESILEQFEVDEQVLRKDLASFAEVLLAEGIIEPVA